MGIQTKAVIRDVKIAELRIGDKLLQDIRGYKDRALLYAGTNISHKEIIFLRKQIARPEPKLAAERYILGNKAPGRICDKDGEVLVKPGQEITAERLAPLLEQGFIEVATEAGGTMYTRKSAWDKDTPCHINVLNPVIRVETMTYVDEETKKELPDPRGAGVAVDPEAGKAKGNKKETVKA